MVRKEVATPADGYSRKTSAVSGTRQTKKRKWLLFDEGKYHLIMQKLKAQRISKKSETKKENLKIAKFQEFSDRKSGYLLAYSESFESVMISKTAMPQ